METIGQKIKKLRNERKLTQQELADKIGVSFTTVSLYESDTRKPSFKALKRISDVFDITPAYFFDGNDNDEIKDEQIRLAARNMQKLNDDDLQTINKLIKTMLRVTKEGED